MCWNVNHVVAMDRVQQGCMCVKLSFDYENDSFDYDDDGDQVVAMHRVGQDSPTDRVGPVSRANCVKLEKLSFDFDYDAVFTSVRPSSR